MATYRSISCELLADGAVLPGLSKTPLSRFTPNAAQRRFESTCTGSFSGLIFRMVFLSARDASTDFPPSFSGRGRSMGASPSACPLFVRFLPDTTPASKVAAGSVFTNVLRFMGSHLYDDLKMACTRFTVSSICFGSSYPMVMACTRTLPHQHPRE